MGKDNGQHIRFPRSATGRTRQRGAKNNVRVTIDIGQNLLDAGIDIEIKVGKQRYRHSSPNHHAIPKSRIRQLNKAGLKANGIGWKEVNHHNFIITVSAEIHWRFHRLFHNHLVEEIIEALQNGELPATPKQQGDWDTLFGENASAKTAISKIKRHWSSYHSGAQTMVDQFKQFDQWREFMF